MIVWNPSKPIDIGEWSISGDGRLETFFCTSDREIISSVNLYLYRSKCFIRQIHVCICIHMCVFVYIFASVYGHISVLGLDKIFTHTRVWVKSNLI